MASLIYHANAVLDPGDGVSHYNISRWSWQHPELLFSHWGKPLYTLLSSPFTQFGFKGLMVFNLILTPILAVYLFLLAKKLRLIFPILAPILCILAPYYTHTLLAGLTEVLFATVLIVGIYYVVKEKWLIGAIILSFLPFARTEAYFVLPFVALYFALHKQWINGLFLGFGIVFYSLFGGIILGDLLWIINDHPYAMGNGNVYGSGSLWHFYLRRYELFGHWNSNLVHIGLLLLIAGLFVKPLKNQTLPWWLLIALPTLSIFFIHSFFWWNGGFGSVGLLRVLVTILPLFSIIAAYAFNILSLIPWRPGIVKIVGGLLVVVFSWHALGGHAGKLDFPLEESEYQQTLSDAAHYYKTIEDGELIYYTHPYFAFRADINIYEQDEAKRLSGETMQYLKSMKEGTLFLWDAHLGNNEMRIKLDTLLAQKELSVINAFAPVTDVHVLGGNPWSVVLLKKTANPKKQIIVYQDSLVLDSLPVVMLASDKFSKIISYLVPKFNNETYQDVEIDLTYQNNPENKTGDYAFSLTLVSPDGELKMYRKRPLHMDAKGDHIKLKKYRFYLPKKAVEGSDLRALCIRSGSPVSDLTIKQLEIKVSEYK